MASFTARFPAGKLRRKILEYNQSRISQFAKDGLQRIIDEGHYTWLDSPVDGYKSSSFENTFKVVLPKNESGMRLYIEKVLAYRNGKAIGIEFGGTGRQIFESLSKLFVKTAGVTLFDHGGFDPDTQDYLHDHVYSNPNGHTVIEGDILSRDLYKQLETWLSGQRVDFIIERMAAGLEFIPGEPYTAAKILSLWYSLLRENGLMFIQVPIIFNPIFIPWAEMISLSCEQTLDIAYQKGSQDYGPPSSVLRIHKKPGAPNELPLLSPRIVRKISLDPRY